MTASRDGDPLSMDDRSDAAREDWYAANQKDLSAAVAIVREALERHAAGLGVNPTWWQRAWREHQLRAANVDPPPALQSLTAAFGLTSFERSVLVLAAGLELEGSFGQTCASAQGDVQKAYPTFGLALAAFPDAHWSAITPAAPLRRWRLVDTHEAVSITASPVRIDERVLHHLAGVDHVDQRLVSFLSSVQSTENLLASQGDAARKLISILCCRQSMEQPPVVELCGEDYTGRLAVAANVCLVLGICLERLPSEIAPSTPQDLEAFLRLWNRENRLRPSALLLDYESGRSPDGIHEVALDSLIESVEGPLIISCREPRRVSRRPVAVLEVKKPTRKEQWAVWKSVLPAAHGDVDSTLASITSQFNLSASTIRTIGAVSEDFPVEEVNSTGHVTHHFQDGLWDLCRGQSRHLSTELARQIEPKVAWDDLVLPDAQLDILRQIAIHVRQRSIVYEDWGFAAKSERGLGITALFSGPSGTGKTLAAEVLAHELRLDFHIIDLSAILSKFIGETEKNLRRAFDAAENGGAILLFDEADALFGRRSEIRDSHDRYANIEISYLLQRMESYRGLAILTTNMKEAVDPAFMRRIRFVVDFPFPDAVQRAEIWRRTFPPGVPTLRLDFAKLARLNVTGGTIRNIALGASFLAADEGEPVRMEHLSHAARTEYAKLGKPVTETEMVGWL